MTAITGNTYPVRQELRAMGGTWDAAHKAWIVPDAKADAARELVGNARRESRPARSGRANGRRYNGGGGAGYQYTDRYGSAHFGSGCGCEDYPCCGH